MPAPVAAPPLVNPPAATPGLRTLGTGATEAAAGNDARLRTPSNAQMTPAAGKIPVADFSGRIAPGWLNLGDTVSLPGQHNVKAYGALGDGLVDDTVAIQAAITAAAGRGAVFVPPGIYIVHYLRVPADSVIVGSGTSSTLKLKPLLLGHEDPILSVEGSNVRIQWLRFDGNKAAQSADGFSDAFLSTNPIQVDQGLAGARGRAYRAAIRGFKYDGSGLADGDIVGLEVSDCEFVGTYGACVTTCNAHGIKIIRCKSTDCNFELGFSMLDYGRPVTDRVNGFDAMGCEILRTGSGDPTTNGNAFVISYGKDVKVLGNKCDTVERNFVKLEHCESFIVSDNKVDNVTIDSFAPVQAQFAAKDGIVSNNVFNNCWEIFQLNAANLYGPATPTHQPAWAGDTVYCFGTIVQNDGGNVYKALVPGVSAHSGGPSGTASDIVDGEVHWKWLGNGEGYENITVTGNVTRGRPSTARGDGISVNLGWLSGLTISDNSINHQTRHGIYIVPAFGVDGVAIKSNQIQTQGSFSSAGIAFQCHGGDWDNITVADNDIVGEAGIYIQRDGAETIRHLSITGGRIVNRTRGTQALSEGPGVSIVQHGILAGIQIFGSVELHGGWFVSDDVALLGDDAGNPPSSVPGLVRVATSSPVTLLPTDKLVLLAMAVPGPVTVNLPAEQIPGSRITIKDATGDAGSNPVTVTVPYGRLEDLNTQSRVFSTNGFAATFVYGGVVSGVNYWYQSDRPDVHRINVRDFGAKGNGTNDTSAILHAVQLALQSGSELYFPPGNYLISSTLELQRAVGLVIRGAGKWLSKISWAGPPGNPILKLYNCREVCVQDLYLCGTSNPAQKPSACVEVQGDSTDPDLIYAPTSCVFKRCMFAGSTSGSADYGVAYTIALGSVDQNNDLGRFENCSFTNVDTGFYNQHANGKIHSFTACFFSNGVQGVLMDDGSFQMRDCYLSQHSVADVVINSISDGITLQRCTSEMSERFLKWAAAHGENGLPVTIVGNRISLAPTAVARDVISILDAGALIVRGNTIKGSNSAAQAPYIYVSSGASADRIVIEDNTFDHPHAARDYPSVACGSGKFNITYRNNIYRDTRTPGHSYLIAMDGTLSITDIPVTIEPYMNGWTILGARSGGGAQIITLPTTTVLEGFEVTFKNSGGDPWDTYVDGTVDGVNPYKLRTPYEAVTFIFDGVNWWNKSKRVVANRITWGTSAPASGSWTVGDVVYHSAPEAGGNLGWVCVVAGSPGTWKPFGPIGL